MSQGTSVGCEAVGSPSAADRSKVLGDGRCELLSFATRMKLFHLDWQWSSNGTRCP